MGILSRTRASGRANCSSRPRDCTEPLTCRSHCYASGTAAACDTHLFLNGDTDDDTFEMLQRVAANTCYLHQTMIATTPLKVSVRHNGDALAMRESASSPRTICT